MTKSSSVQNPRQDLIDPDSKASEPETTALVGCVTMGELLHLSESQLPHLHINNSSQNLLHTALNEI